MTRLTRKQMKVSVRHIAQIAGAVTLVALLATAFAGPSESFAADLSSKKGMPMNTTPANVESMAATLQALMDRTEIEDLFVHYYSGLGGTGPETFKKFYVDDAELDVNGIVVHGYDEISDLYKRVAIDKPNLTGTFRMLFNNPVIHVNGDTATAQFLWTQTLNDTIKGPPRLIEQGREFDKLVKQGGKWRIKKRVVIADSGLPDMMDKTYKPRKDYTLESGN